MYPEKQRSVRTMEVIHYGPDNGQVSPKNTTQDCERKEMESPVSIESWKAYVFLHSTKGLCRAWIPNPRWWNWLATDQFHELWRKNTVEVQALMLLCPSFTFCSLVHRYAGAQKPSNQSKSVAAANCEGEIRFSWALSQSYFYLSSSQNPCTYVFAW